MDPKRCTRFIYEIEYGKKAGDGPACCRQRNKEMKPLNRLAWLPRTTATNLQTTAYAGARWW